MKNTLVEIDEGRAPYLIFDANSSLDGSVSYGTSYEIIGGADGALFHQGSGGAYTYYQDFPNGADYEMPLDANRDNIYEVEVRATASHASGSEVGVQTLLLKVNNIAERPVLTQDTASVTGGSTVGGNVLANDTDSDGNATMLVDSVASVRQPGQPFGGSTTVLGEFGTLTISADGAFSYFADRAHSIIGHQT